MLDADTTDVATNGHDAGSPPTKRQKSNEPDTNGTSDHDAEGANGTNDEPQPAAPVSTPRKRGRPPKAKTQSTPTSSAKSAPPSIFQTPTKNSLQSTPSKQAADRSARRKTVRSLIEQVAGDAVSDDEEQDEETLAREIYGDSDGEEGLSQIDVQSEATADEKTPKKRRRRAKSPTPPKDLPPHEMYFFHNKPGRPKTSDNSLSSLTLLTHDEYFSVLEHHEDQHSNDIEYLESLHAGSFTQWSFELSQGFSLCLYGYGSKRKLLHKYATRIYQENAAPGNGKVIMINGYTPTTNIREILVCINSAIDSSRKILTAQPPTMAQNILSHLSSTNLTITLIVNSIDAPPLRKPASQTVLAQLAAHKQVNLVCSADSPDFSLLWDIGLRSAFNFVYHDCTTFAPMAVELDAVDEVHELLGRKAHRVHGREGVAFVLKSLPENAKNLFQLLVGEVLIAMEDDSAEDTGVEYRMVYNKAVEEFICSSEMAFRTLLKEYVYLPWLHI